MSSLRQWDTVLVPYSSAVDCAPTPPPTAKNSLGITPKMDGGKKVRWGDLKQQLGLS